MNSLDYVQNTLWGKSHYFDATTLRYFGARHGDYWRFFGPPITRRAYRNSKDRVKVHNHRYVAVVESVKPPNNPHRYRVLVVDLQMGRVARTPDGTKRRADAFLSKATDTELRKVLKKG